MHCEEYCEKRRQEKWMSSQPRSGSNETSPTEREIVQDSLVIIPLTGNYGPKHRSAINNYKLSTNCVLLHHRISFKYVIFEFVIQRREEIFTRDYEVKVVSGALIKICPVCVS